MTTVQIAGKKFNASRVVRLQAIRFVRWMEDGHTGNRRLEEGDELSLVLAKSIVANAEKLKMH